MAKQKKSKVDKNILLPAIAVVISVLTLLGHMYLINQQKDMAQEATKKKEVKLPSNAVKLSGCVPYMGEHWAVPETLPRGPLYFTHNGKVIGIEYMIGPDEIPNQELANAKTPQEAIAYMQKNNLTFADTVYPHFTRELQDYDINFMSLEWTQPHAGYVAPHYDMHFYFIDKSEVDQICPDSKIENIDTPEIRKKLDELNIPYPGSQQQTP